MRRLAILMGSLAVLVAGAAARAEALHTKLPQDTLGFVELDPTVLAAAGAKAEEGSALLDAGVQTLSSLGLVPKGAMAVADVLALIAETGARHSVVALLDADLRPIGAGKQVGLECRSVQLAWLIDVQGHPQDMLSRLNGTLKILSTQKTARQSVRTTAEGKREFVEFFDTRWPEWLKLCWMQEGDLFVMTLGAGAMEHYLADRPVGGVGWTAALGEADAAAEKMGLTGKVVLRTWIGVKGFRERFPEAMSKTMLGRLAGALEVEKYDAWMLTARAQGRLISMDAAGTAAGVLTSVPWTVPGADKLALAKVVPGDASGYMVMEIAWPQLYRSVAGILDAVAPHENGLSTERNVERFCVQNHLDLQKDILGNMQPLVLVHDSPRHPLGVPLMWTVVAAARAGEKERTQKASEALFGALCALVERSREGIEAPAGGAGGGNEFARVHLRADKGGATYVQYGLIGPAWMWSEGRLVYSWSPAAVRYVVPTLKGVGAEVFGREGRGAGPMTNDQ